jgi:transcriptional regulator with XRE-family HTH domain
MRTLLAEKESVERRRITQDEIADATGLRRATVSKWMSPKTKFKMIDSEAWTKLARFLGVPPEKMLHVDYEE